MDRNEQKAKIVNGTLAGVNTEGVSTDAARLGIIPPMAGTPGFDPARAGLVEDTGGGNPVLWWALAIGGLLWSLSTGKRKIRVF